MYTYLFVNVHVNLKVSCSKHVSTVDKNTGRFSDAPHTHPHIWIYIYMYIYIYITRKYFSCTCELFPSSSCFDQGSACKATANLRAALLKACDKAQLQTGPPLCHIQWRSKCLYITVFGLFSTWCRTDTSCELGRNGKSLCKSERVWPKEWLSAKSCTRATRECLMHALDRC